LAGIVVIYQMQRFSGLLILLIYSFWVPQIIHNMHHDHRKPLLLRYIVGMSATRHTKKNLKVTLYSDIYILMY
jgi:transmembrane E3 ubiquitin-protein ligase